MAGRSGPAPAPGRRAAAGWRSAPGRRAAAGWRRPGGTAVGRPALVAAPPRTAGAVGARPPGRGPLRRPAGPGLGGGVAAAWPRGPASTSPWSGWSSCWPPWSRRLWPVVYVLAWLLMPTVGSDREHRHKAAADRRGIALAAGAASLLIVRADLADLHRRRLVRLRGLAAGHRRGRPGADLAERRRATSRRRSGAWPSRCSAWPRAAPGKRATVLRAAVAAVLLIARPGHPGASAHESIKMLRPLGGVVLVIAAIAVVLGPWWLRHRPRPGRRAPGPDPGRGAGRHGHPGA